MVVGATGGTRLLEDVVEVRPRGPEGRQQAKEDRGEEDEAAAVHEHAGVDVEVLEEGHAGLLAAGDAGEEEREAQARGEEPEEPSDDGEHEALGEQLPEEAGAPGAEGRPHGHLLLAGAGPGEEQVGHVGAGHEKHQGDAGEEEHQDWLDLADEDVAERDDLHRDALHVGGEPAAELGGERGGALLGLAERGSVAEAGDGVDPVETPAPLHVVARLNGEHHAGVGPGSEGEAGRQDADDGVRVLVEDEGATEDVRVGAHPVSPEGVGQDDRARAAVHVLAGEEGAAEL